MRWMQCLHPDCTMTAVCYSSWEINVSEKYNRIFRHDDFGLSSTRATGFGTAQRLPLFGGSDVPGPNYYPPDPDIRPAVVFGHSARDTSPPLRRDVENPSPDAYSPDRHSNVHLGFIGSEPRFTHEHIAFTPGPRYIPPSTLDHRGAVFPTSDRSPILMHRLDNPGPSDYTLSPPDSHLPLGVFDRAQRFRERMSDVPGPQQYRLFPSPIRPTVRFPTSQRPPLQHSDPDIPGPASYDTRTRTTSPPRISFTTSTRPPLQRPDMDVPGPGTYSTLSRSTSAPHVRFTTAPRPPLQHADTDIPGPASYDTRQRTTSPPHIGFARALREMGPSSNGPGPAAYNVQRPASAPATSFAMSQRETTKSPDGPGPAAYHLPDAAIHPSVIFGKDQRFHRDGQATDVPGPAYDLGSTISQMGVSFPGAPRFTEDAQARDVPGPGAYAIGSTLQTAGVAFPLAQRFAEKLTDGPGPAAYLPALSSDVHDVKFDKDRRFVEPPRDGPGPGEYAPQYQHTNTAVPFTTADRFAALSKENGVPGPDAYSPHYQDGQHNVKFDHAQRFADLGRDDGFPAPNAYEPHYPDTQQGVKFGHADRFDGDDRDNMPGPAHYDLPEYRPSSAYRFGGDQRFHDFDNGIYVGPQSYSPKRMDAFRATGFTRAERFDTQGDHAGPGPDAYILRPIPIRPSVRFPLSTRFEDNSRHVVDAMYDVQLPSHVVTTRFGTAPRFADGGRSATAPGPADYDVQLQRDTHGIRFGEAERFERDGRDGAPGPGAYAPKQSYPSAANVRFGHAERFDRDRFDWLPGPGAYDVKPQPLRDVSFTRSLRFVQERESLSTPGPGTYTPTRPSSAPPAVRFGDGERFVREDGDAVPGPGAYTPKLSEVGPFYSIPTANRFNDVFERGSESVLHPDKPQFVQAHRFGGAQRFGDRVQQTPGPDDYVSAFKPLKPSGPTFGLSPRFARYENEDQPGPGTYTPKIYTTAGGIKFTLARRWLPDSQSDFPGPAHYAPEYFTRSPSVKFSTALRFTNDPSADAPGPGAYRLPDMRAAYNVLFDRARRWDDGTADAGPGPASYSPKRPSSAPTFRFTGANRWDGRDSAESPGPGSYTPTVGGRRSPSVGFGRAPRFTPEFNQDSPGPGAYSPSLRARSPSPAFGRASRWVSELTESGPGPASYSPQLLRSSPGVSIGSSLRFVEKVEVTPGPGEYNPKWIPRRLSPGIGSGARFARTLFSDSPGPAAYDVRLGDNSTSVGFTHAERFGKDDATTASPGPATYAPQLQSNSAQYSFPRAERRTEGGDTGSPGPGAYPLHDERGTGVTFPVAERTGTSETIGPGPAAYNVQLRSNSPSYTFTSGRGDDDRAKASSPGPGAYSPQNKTAAPAYRFPGAKRFLSFSDNASPGPAGYSLKFPPSQAVVFTKAERFAVPEFGQPVVPLYFPKLPMSSPLWSFPGAPRFAKDTGNDTPGPYLVKSPDIVPNVIFGKATRFDTDKEDDVSPGPGQYGAPDRPHSAPSTWFTRAERFTEDKESTPGFVVLPDPPIHPSVKFTTANRFGSDVDNSSPGPAAYDPKLPSQATNVKISTTARFAAEHDENQPGPGAYTLPDTNDGPKYTMQHRHNEKDNFSDSPGPAAYNPQLPSTATNVHFGSGSRFASSHGSDTPGPSVLPDIPITPSVKFTTEPRFRDHVDDSSPGPAAYNPALSSDAPKVSFGVGDRFPPDRPFEGSEAGVLPDPEIKPSVKFTTEQRFKDHIDYSSPGPAAYNLENNDRGPSASFGVGERFTKSEHDDMPGPYVIPDPPIWPSVKFSTSDRFRDERDNSSPGPAAYLVENNDRGPSASFGVGERFTKSAHDDTPGPYVIPDPAITPNVSFGTAKRFVSVQEDENPGPAAYNVQITDRGPAASFGIGKRFADTQGSDTPGPATLPDPEIRPAVKFGHEQRFKDLTANDSPGPAAYLPETNDRGPSASFGVGTRFKETINESPAFYDLPPYEIRPAVPFSSEPRFRDHSDHASPGPAAYTVEYNDHAPAASMGIGARFVQHIEETPGPDRLPDFPIVPSVSFGKGQRFVDHTDHASPGPAAYNVELPVNTPSASFGIGPRFQMRVEETPGADVLPDFEIRPSFKFGSERRFHDHSDNCSPGPIYDQSLPNDAPAAGFGHGERFARNSNDDNPGPYTIPDPEIRPAVKFGSEPRFKDHTDHASPGPIYEIQSSLNTSQGAGIGIGDRFPPLHANDTPGPYTIPDPEIRPAVKFGTEMRFKDLADHAGPGPIYDPQLIDVSHAPSFGKGERFATRANDSPGYYDPFNPPITPSVSFGMERRFKDQVDHASPGPIYDPQLLDTSRATSLGYGERFPASKANELRGPYTIPDPPITPSVKFGSEQRFKDYAEHASPGPIYDPQLINTSRAAGLGYGERFPPSKANELPGPYTIPDPPIVPSVKFGSEQRFKDHMEHASPGPIYNPEPINTTHVPSFGKGERFAAAKQDGPGFYMVPPPPIVPNVKFGSEQRFTDHADHAGPGPIYDPKPIDTTHATSLGYGERFQTFSSSQTPGPYDVPPPPIRPSVRFGSEPRFQELTNNASPGPIYDVKLQDTSRAASLGYGERFQTPTGSQTPGPYLVPPPPIVPNVKFGSEQRFKDHSDHAGPGPIYDPKPIDTTHVPSFGFGERFQTPAGSQTPGPYTVEPPPIRPSTRFGTEQRFNDHADHAGPGPIYDPKPVDTSRPTSLGYGERFQQPAGSQTPGPYSVPPPPIVPNVKFGSEPRFKDQTDHAGPGPIYDPKPIDTTHVTSLGFGERFRESAVSQTPGPYEVPPPPIRPSVRFGSESRFKDLADHAGPGPIYDPKPVDTSRATSLGYGERFQQTAGAQIPGPYNVPPPPIVPNVKFGSEQRFKDHIDHAGPGPIYDPQPVGAARATSLGFGDRFKQPTGSQTPGPYLVPDPPITPSVKFGGGPRFQELTDNSSPGPIYDPQPVGAPRATSLGYGERFQQPAGSQTPGPYNVPPPPIVPNVKFGSEERFKDLTDHAGPGPIYDPKPIDTTHVASLGYGERFKQPTASQTPGPYNIPEPPITPSVKIGSAPRFQDHIDQSSPGPIYDPKPIDTTHVPSFGAGDRFKDLGRSETPGPYNVPEPSITPSVRIGSAPRFQDHIDHSSPGPIYDPHPVGAPRATGLGYGERFQQLGKSDTPGPYNVPEPPITPSVKIGSAPRFQDHIDHSSPGPVYDPQPVGAPRATGLGYGERFQQAPSSQTPGPYNVQPPPIVPSVKFGSEQRFRDQTEHAGPGPIYDPKPIDTTHVPSFGSGDRFPHRPSDAPGPGDPPRLPEGPSFAFGTSPRFEHGSESVSPGPVYDVRDSNVTTRATGLGMGERFPQRSEQSPGPGPAIPPPPSPTPKFGTEPRFYDD
eukprot:TRINITY_DN109_c0_g1_i3.p1 TRINITY_DN109_c0_g1~~TRINITY_DN109_c0_g1_i3.p1  ORF type:complete len:3375 (-),score=542.39 TRINITY_DN109_c0_g1_i3:9-10133(-)